MDARSKAIELNIKQISEMLFQSAAEGLVVADKDGVIYMANPRINEMFGFGQEELIGQRVEILIPEAARKRHADHRHEYGKNPEKRSMGIGMDLVAQRKDGSNFPVEVSLNHFQVEGETMVMALVSDISERKKSEQRVQLFADIVEHIQLGFVVFKQEKPGDNHSYKITAYNHSAEQLTGLKADFMLGKYLDDAFPEAREQGMLRLFERVVLDGASEIEDTFYIDSRTSERTWSIKAFVLPDQSIGVSFEDVTRRKQAEDQLKSLNAQLERRVKERTRALEDSQRLYQIIARNFPNGDISVFDRDLNYVFVEGKEMYKQNITSEKLVGTSFLDRVDPLVKDEIHEKLMRVFQGENTSFELKSRNKTYLIHAAALNESEEGIKQILMVSQNITSLKRAEEEVQRSLQQERQLNELKSRFVSMASHEFRTPLTTVMNSISLLSKYIGTDGNEEKQQRHVTRIKAAVQDLTGILNDFLSLDKLEEGKVQLRVSEFDVVQLCESLVEDMENMAKKEQEINYYHRGSSEVHTDKQMLKNVIYNLLSNALKYSPAGGVVRLKTQVDRDVLTVMVADNGMGIPEEEQSHLFERFFRAKNALNIQGTGLGLNIVKKYVEMAGGEIDFESTPGEGTSFTIKLPTAP